MTRHIVTSAILAWTFLAVSHSSVAQNDVSTGPSVLGTSDVPSTYMRGVTQTGGATPARLKILGTMAGLNGALVTRVVVLDSSGNHVPLNPDNTGFTVDVGCRDMPFTRCSTAVTKERKWMLEGAGQSMVILCDNSMLSANTAKEVVRSVRNVVPSVSGRDSVSVVTYSHVLDVVTPFVPTAQISEAADPAIVPAPSGLSAVYTSTMSALQMLGEHTGIRSLVIVTTSDDNASFGTSTENLVRLAKKLDVHISVVRVGHSTRGYPYRYISAATGGRLYTVAEADVADVGSIIRELLLSIRQYSEITIPSDALQGVTCEDVWLRVQYEGGKSSALVYDSLLLPTVERSYQTRPSIVATFGDTTEVGLQAFYPILASMAEMLMTDSTIRVELTGHVSGDIRTNADERGLERAEFVRGFLVAYGVKKAQIVTRSDGSRRPLYYIQLDGAQRLLNNRVEARLLYPDEHPYTITVDQVATEEQAGKQADVWEQRGFKAYFEPVVVGNAPAYRVKLWGYRTPEDARKDVRSIARFKPKSAIVE